jgi:hypothetical protein
MLENLALRQQLVALKRRHPKALFLFDSHPGSLVLKIWARKRREKM